MGVPSKLSVIRKVATLVRVRSTLLLRCEEKDVRRKSAWGTLYDVLIHITVSLVGDVFVEDGGLGDVDLQGSILLEDMFELSQDLKRHAHLVLM